MASEKAEFDPYLKWLGIHPKDQPPNHYRLLGVELFESDPDVISNAADARMMLVKTFQCGGNSKLSQRILNEVVAAKVCLLAPGQKAKYDDELRRRLAPPIPVSSAAESSRWWSLWGAIAGSLVGLLIVVLAWLWLTERDQTARLRQTTPQSSNDVIAGDPIPLHPAEGATADFGGDSAARPGEAGAGTGAPGAVDQPEFDTREEGAGPPAVAAATAEGPAEATGPASAGEAPAAPGSGVPPQGDPTTDSAAATEPPSAGLTQDALPVDEPQLEPTAPAPEAAQSALDTVEMPSAPADEAAMADETPLRLPVPSRPDRQREERELRESFRNDLARARTAQHKLALAEEMYRQGVEKAVDPATQYVLFQMACELSSSAGEISRTMRAADEIAGRFEIEALRLKAQMLDKAIELTRNAPALSLANLEVVENGLLLADAALASGKIDLAQDFLNSAGVAARRSKSSELIQEVNGRTKSVESARKEQEKVEAALKTLEQDPANAEANLVVGGWHCFVAGDWEEGLPYLAACGDAAIAAAARRDLAGPADPNEQLAVGEAWWKIAQREQGQAKARIAERAAEFFNLALAVLPLDATAGPQTRSQEIAQAAAMVGPDLSGMVKAGNVAAAANGTVVTGALNGPAIVDGIIPRTVNESGIAVAAWPCEWLVTLDDVYRLREVRMKLPDNSPQGYVLSTSPDGQQFQTLADRSKGGAMGWQRIWFLSRPVKVVKIQGLFHGGNSMFYVTELEAYCAPPSAPPQ